MWPPKNNAEPRDDTLTRMPRIKFTLNGRSTEAAYEPGMHFLEVLREECGVVSPKDGCAPEGTCGCCLVMVDGTPALSCLRKPEQMAGRSVTTVEGLPDETRRVLSEAFVLEGGVQCGFCIPGILVRAASLIENGRTGDRRASVSLHGLRTNPRLDSNRGRGVRERRTPAAHRAAPAFLLRRRVRAQS